VAVFHYRRRVHFAETDQAGIVHFSNYFKYMEEAEHALWRAAGLTISRIGETTGWPRVAASCDYKAPLRYQDDVDVEVALARVGRRTLHYAFTLRRGDLVVATGAITTAHVEKAPDGSMSSANLPEEVVARLQAALGS
jgi:acyl-CoA thioester hydrolase